MSQFTFYTDPGHGWLAVPVADLLMVDMTPEDFSFYSYKSRNGQVLYLEEDCDAPKFIDQWQARYGRPDMTEVYHDRTFIRSLPRIRG